MSNNNQSTLTLFPELAAQCSEKKHDTTEKLTRLDLGGIKEKLLPFCRLKYGEIWEDPIKGHRVGVLDATNYGDVERIMGDERIKLIVNDPPYNVVVGNKNTENLFKKTLADYMVFSQKWVQNATAIMAKNAHLYIWLGADQKDGFQPLADVLIMMREFKELRSRNFITLRNQRGYGTQKNWMWVRQELLHYVKGDPKFKVVYTDIPKILKGYYKVINGKRTENMERSKSDCIRPGNVWIDIQQVFYRMQENVPGCYAQKPVKAIERIILTSSTGKDTVVDFFAHSGTTLLAGEKLDRKVYTFDNDPIFAELTIRRLEQYRQTSKCGWQWNNPFPEVDNVDGGQQRWI
ncbi:site-specific DNA-methyltransferase [Candidatus Aerophobetes bacterium Ae_b3a]|nr:MAG: site-specific DNA-methyltransferase [Candidatus Aerophobetes bacterium Ae_b3a]